MITVRFREDDSFHVLFSVYLSGHELHILVHSQYHFISQMVSMLVAQMFNTSNVIKDVHKCFQDAHSAKGGC